LKSRDGVTVVTNVQREGEKAFQSSRKEFTERMNELRDFVTIVTTVTPSRSECRKVCYNQ